MAFAKISVGDKLFNPTRQDIIQFDMTASGGLLSVQFNKPSAKEKQAFKDSIQLKVAVVDGIIFILARMGTLSWMDAPFFHVLAISSDLPEIPDDQSTGLFVHCLLADSSTGVLLAQKIIGLDHDVSVKLIDAIRRQQEENLSLDEYDRKLDLIYRRYSTEDLLLLSESAKEDY